MNTRLLYFGTHAYLTKGRATFFRPETIIESFLHLMCLLFKVLFNHTHVKSIF